MIRLVNVSGFIGRAWYYFRVGYSTYLTFILGAANTLIVVWYLAIKDVPSIESIFHDFLPFALVTTAVGIPLSIVIGWIHFKRSSLYTSEQDIGQEADPYNYRFPPGFWTEVFGPLFLELLLQTKQILEANDLLVEEDRIRIVSLEQKLRLLNSGGIVGTPRKAL